MKSNKTNCYPTIGSHVRVKKNGRYGVVCDIGNDPKTSETLFTIEYDEAKCDLLSENITLHPLTYSEFDLI